jgi:hypothetical protein
MARCKERYCSKELSRHSPTEKRNDFSIAGQIVLMALDGQAC